MRKVQRPMGNFPLCSTSSYIVTRNKFGSGRNGLTCARPSSSARRHCIGIGSHQLTSVAAAAEGRRRLHAEDANDHINLIVAVTKQTLSELDPKLIGEMCL